MMCGVKADGRASMNGYEVSLAVNPIAAAEVAAAHQGAPRMGGPFALGAYCQLSRESDRLFKRVTEARRPVRIFFTMSTRPYCDADELITSIRRDRVLEVTTVARERDRLHPVMGCEVGGAYDRFRAVHEVLGHGYLDVGFDRDGEHAAWIFQERFHSPLARQALATELHGEHSVRWTTGDLPEHKATVLDEQLIGRSRVGRPDIQPAYSFAMDYEGGVGGPRSTDPPGKAIGALVRPVRYPPESRAMKTLTGGGDDVTGDPNPFHRLMSHR
jgi:hypothetical protein